MQRLHLVGFTTEHDGLVFSARKGSKAGGYIIPLDKELLSTIAEAERLRNGDKGEGEAAAPRERPTSRLTPREIQAYLRSGRSIPEVAAEAGVDADWVERFAVPVVAEQSQMVERARAMTYSKARLGQSTQSLGTSVRWNLADKGVGIGEEEFEQGWSAFQLQDEVWMIRFRYTSRARLQVAEWELDLGTNQLTSRNRLASELGYVEKGRRPPALPAPAPRVPAAPPMRVVEDIVDEPDPEPEEHPAPVRSAPRRRSPARRTRRATARKKGATRKAPAKKASAKRSSTKRPSAKKTTAKKTSAKKTTAKKAKKTTRKKATRKATRRTQPRATRRPATKAVAPTKSVTRASAPPRKAPTTATRPAPRPVAKKQELRPPRRRPIATRRPTPAQEPEPELGELDLPLEPEMDLDVDAPPTTRRAPRHAEGERPRIAASSAKDAAKRTAPPRRPRPVRKVSSSGRVSSSGKVSSSDNASSSDRASSSDKASSGDKAGSGDRAASSEKATKSARPANPALSGPLARSLLARRLMARKAAGGDGGQPSKRPLRVR